MNYIATRDGVVFPSGYVDYMENRPRSHGLFGDDEVIDIAKTKEEIDNYTGRIWTHIISLKREDASRLGYDTPEDWRELLQTHRNDIAQAMHIPMKNFRWVASFHDEGEHPHVHMMAWSVNPSEGYLDKNGISEIKSELTNTIFQMELAHIYDMKTQSRNELIIEAKQKVSELSKNIKIENPMVFQMMKQLSVELKKTSGKKSYGYMKKPVKKLVDKIVDEIAKETSVASCFEMWQDYQAKIENYYHDRDYDRKELSIEKAFRSIKNAIIKEADKINSSQNESFEINLPSLIIAVAVAFSDSTDQWHEQKENAEQKEKRSRLRDRQRNMIYTRKPWEMKY